MTDEEKRIRELPSLIVKEPDTSVVQKLATELYDLLTRRLEAKKLQSTERAEYGNAASLLNLQDNSEGQ
jgi:hypothetical protein